MNNTTIKLIRLALLLVSLIGVILTAQAAEFGASLAEILGSILMMLAGMTGFAMSYFVTIKGGAR